MARRVSFTDLVSEPIEAQFTPDGPWYRFPGDIPLPILAHIEAYRERLRENPDDPDVTGGMVDQLRADVLELFRVQQPDIQSFEELPCTLPQALTIVTRLYLTAEDTDGADEGPPTRPKSRGVRASSSSRSGS